jgi:hypothetical protein
MKNCVSRAQKVGMVVCVVVGLQMCCGERSVALWVGQTIVNHGSVDDRTT